MTENNEVMDNLDVSTSEEVVEVAEPLDNEVDEGAESNAEVTTEENSVEPEEPKRNRERDAIYAEARRAAEREQKAIDEEYVRRFGNLENPITHKKISSQRDYLEALDAQERLEREEQFKSSGIDLNDLQKYIDNSPQMKEARELKEKLEQYEVQERLANEIRELSKLDNSIKTIEDIPQEIMQFAIDNRMSVTNAYKICNYGKTTQAKNEAIVQRAVNQAKSKSHLAPVNGVAQTDNSVDIPSNLISMWRQCFPDKSDSELRKLYNDTL